MTATSYPHLRQEQLAWRQGKTLVCGLDEVGRGALAGPVSVGAVVVPVGPLPRTSSPLRKVRDSKQLSVKLRESLVDPIVQWALASAVGHASALECDRLGMTAALRLAAERALEAVEAQGVVPDAILLDGPYDYLAQPGRVTTIVKGDTSSLAIAASSVLAKVERDQIMASMAEIYTGYDLAKNAGYSSPAHKAGLVKMGPCDIHRRSWSFMDKINNEQLSLLDEL